MQQWLLQDPFHGCLAALGLFGRRIPDRRGIGALGGGHRDFLGHRDAEVFRVVGGPARRWDFDDAAVVKGALAGVEVRVFPDGDQFRVRRWCWSMSRSRRPPCCRRTGTLPSAPGLRSPLQADVIDFLVHFTLRVEPAFDDLIAVEIRADRVFQCSDKESRRLACRCVTQIAAHWHAFGVSDLRGHPVVRVRGFEIEAAEEAHDHPRAGGGVGLAALHRVEDRLRACSPVPRRRRSRMRSAPSP